MKYLVTLQSKDKVQVVAVVIATTVEQAKTVVITKAKAVATKGKSKVIVPGKALEVIKVEEWVEDTIKVLNGGKKFTALVITKSGVVKEDMVIDKASIKSVYAYICKQSNLKPDALSVVFIKDLEQSVQPELTVKNRKGSESMYKSPVYGVRAVPIDKIIANEYNPNSVAPPEMQLLYESIKQDGYTMPIVCYYNDAEDVYEIVDGFHRYTIMLKYKDIYDRERGLLPVSVINKPIDERMASTIRHNRARGSHDVDLMSNIVAELNELGRSDAWISKHLGMDLDEVIRLKQITGLAALFKDKDFSRSWKPVV